MDEPDKSLMVYDSFNLLLDSMDKDDIVSVVTYAGTVDTLINGEKASNRKDIQSALKEAYILTAEGGGTNGSGGIIEAYKIAKENFIEGGNNRVIIASDGDMNLGQFTSNDELVTLIEEYRDDNIFLTTLGYGHGNYSDYNMESIANHGNGNYYYIDSKIEAERVLVERLKQSTETVAKDVKIQVEFNPNFVEEYHLIGYENRQMAAEDFEDDTKDGGETGAGQQVTVLYEVKLADGDSSTSNLKYQDERELKIMKQ
jgi:Ca-activated chloride channel family protein